MRNIFIVIFISITSLSWGQKTLLKYQSTILSFEGQLASFNTFEIGRLLELHSNSVSEDSLTFNSSAQLVTYANADTVVLDGNTDVVIDNYVRFGLPLTGTIYKINDTLGSSDTLILGQPFTGIVTDEFYWGGVGKIYDASGEGNNALQTTAVNQPKLLDPSTIKYDGINDYLYVPDNDDLSFGDGLTDSPFTISIWVKLDALGAQSFIGKHTADLSGREYKIYTLSTTELLFVLYDESTNGFIGRRNIFLTSYLDDWFNITCTYDGVDINGMKIFIDNVLTSTNTISGGSYVAMENTTTPLYLGGLISNSYMTGESDDVYLYSRVLTERERTYIYQNSIHYTP